MAYMCSHILRIFGRMATLKGRNKGVVIVEMTTPGPMMSYIYRS